MEAADKIVYSDLVSYCLSISLKPKKVYKSNVLAVDFIHMNQNNAVVFNANTIIRIGIDQNKKPIFAFRYYASKQYSEKFHEAIKNEIDSCKGEYKGCLQCGKKHCKTRYIYKHPNGKSYIRCGFGFVTINNITKQDIPEIKGLIETQIKFYNEAIES